jgi:hypothetical protein
MIVRLSISYCLLLVINRINSHHKGPVRVNHPIFSKIHLILKCMQSSKGLKYQKNMRKSNTNNKMNQTNIIIITMQIKGRMEI